MRAFLGKVCSRAAAVMLWSVLLRLSFVMLGGTVVGITVLAIMHINDTWSGHVGRALAVLGVVLAIDFVRFKRAARVKGFYGELLVRITLLVWFPLSRRFHNVYLPLNDTVTQIDHILVCTRGVFVIETKNWSGELSGRLSDRTWTLQRRGRSVQTVNPVRQNSGHVAAVLPLVPTCGDIYGIVAIVGSATLRTAPVATVVFGLRGLLLTILTGPESGRGGASRLHEPEPGVRRSDHAGQLSATRAARSPQACETSSQGGRLSATGFQDRSRDVGTAWRSGLHRAPAVG